MRRKLFAAALFALACSATLYASSSNAEAAEEAPAPRPAAEDAKPGAKGKFGGFGGGKLDPEKLKELKEKFGGKGFDPAKLKDFKGKFDPEKLKEFKGKIDPEKLKEFKGKFDPEKLKDLKGKFGKGGFGKKDEE